MKKIKKKAPSKKMGAPLKFSEEKDKQLQAILRLKPTLADCAAFLDVSEDTIERHIKKSYKCTYAEFREQKMVHSRFMVVRNILRECEKGNPTMLIYASKNLCGWKDKHEIDHGGSVNINFDKDDKGL